LIVACAENRVIGRGGQLPWRIAEDWQFFKKQTAGQIVILGRISYESWRSVLDDERQAVVLTQNKSLAQARVHVEQSLGRAIERADTLGAADRIFICGGQRIFEEALHLPRIRKLFLTLIHSEVAGDRYFPAWRAAFPTVLSQREGRDENFRYTFYELARRAGDQAPIGQIIPS
jgi:dihydrofolate reductase